MELRNQNLPLLGLFCVIFFWGAGPVITKLITLHPMLGSGLRFALSIPLLFAIVRFRGGQVTAATFRQAMLPGLAFGINLMFVFAALQEIPVALMTVAIALQPAVLLIVAGPLFNERPTPSHVAWTVVGIVGTIGVILGAGPEVSATALGLILAFSAMLTFTIYFALTRLARSTTDVDPFEWMAAINVWSLVAIIPPALFTIRGEQWAEFDGRDLFWLLVLAFVTGVAGHVLMSWVHGYIEAARSSLYLLGMNIVAVALAWPIHGEPVSVVQMLSGVIVLFAVAMVIRIPAQTTTP